MKKKMPLHIKILLGMLAGIVFGLLAAFFGWIQFTYDWIKPWGDIFINLLKLIAIPLIFVSLVKGISGLTDITRLSKIGFKTIGLYILSTVIAISFGLLLVNTIEPGKAFPADKGEEYKLQYSKDVLEKKEGAHAVNRSPLRFFVDIVPENIVDAAGDNSNMLQMIFFAFMFGIAMVMLPKERMDVVRNFFDGVNDIILKIIDIIMKAAPYGVFALLATLIVEVTGDNIERSLDLFAALGLYSLTVLLGLMLMIILIYPALLRIFTRKISYMEFLKGIFPAQMLAFSTSSSAATLPVTMERCENKLGVPKEISSFVLPIGATVNMDGTSLYQAVAAIFIAQAFGFDLSLAQQLTIVLTATLASIGAAAVPSAGIVMLVIVLESVGVPSEGIALIFAIDRPLDMFRTTVNVTGDSAIATIISKTEDKLQK